MTVSTEDMIQIRTLYSEYNHRVDMLGDAQGVADLFVEDGTYDHGKYEGVLVGREAIRGFMQRAVDTQGPGYQHWNGNLLVDGDAERADVTAYVMTVDGTVNPPVFARNGMYRDQIVKTADGWRFKSRRVGYPLAEFRK